MTEDEQARSQAVPCNLQSVQYRALCDKLRVAMRACSVVGGKHKHKRCVPLEMQLAANITVTEQKPFRNHGSLQLPTRIRRDGSASTHSTRRACSARHLTESVTDINQRRGETNKLQYAPSQPTNSSEETRQKKKKSLRRHNFCTAMNNTARVRNQRDSIGNTAGQHRQYSETALRYRRQHHFQGSCSGDP